MINVVYGTYILTLSNHFRTKMDKFSSGPPPEHRSLDMQPFTPGDHNRQRGKDIIQYEEHPRRSRSPMYVENPQQNNKNISPYHSYRTFSPNHNQSTTTTPSSSRDISPSFGHRSKHLNERPQSRRSPQLRRDRSREKHRRISPRKNTSPLPVESSSNQLPLVQSPKKRKG